MDLGIKGKRAVVIGGSSGLGLAASRSLAAEGVDLVLFARNPENLDEAKASLVTEHGTDVYTVAGDITDPDDVRRLRDEIARTGGVDILVLNTPRPPSPMRDFLDENEDERWDAAYRDQLQAALSVLRTITPLMLDRGWGRIIGITSASVKQPMPRHALSSIFRAGVQTALKHLVAEVGPHGVTVNTIAPATVMTPTFEKFHNLERRIQGTALKRHGLPEELGGTVAFLASQQAGYITGELIQLDGGMTVSLV
ncbi:SDR family oxidoreductase [Aeromicrobium sp. 636]|uniref:SDR family oxidoreductase n=1 Tax=Aeromicrobium senzhongii TaxID=2663859 RepID=A0A8I0K0K7_9ACTN|nr:SDR family oxidoreductase [Aeromicrobium sp. 636]MBC9226476.1 SDR family oxidoreductase [Aeromicrobium senzhongii]MCQ3998580.1 SDR family oxidoreductase [Aeromicrobium sp. 636]